MKDFRRTGIAGSLALASMVTASVSNAAVVSGLKNLDIGGTLYDVTFNTGGGNNAFNSYWDADNDGIYGGGTSIFSSAPLYAGDTIPDASQVARDAIIAALGTTDSIAGTSGSDRFYIPFNVALTSTSGDKIRVQADWNAALTTEDPLRTYTYDGSIISSDIAWVSFAPAAVPLPASFYLMLVGLISLGGVVKRGKGSGTNPAPNG